MTLEKDKEVISEISLLNYIILLNLSDKKKSHWSIKNSKKISLNSIIKYVNSIKCNAKCNCLFKKFLDVKNSDYSDKYIVDLLKIYLEQTLSNLIFSVSWIM